MRRVFRQTLQRRQQGSSIELDISSEGLTNYFVRRIQEFEVNDALKRMDRGKAMGPDGIPIEVWRSLGDVVIV
jgi:hypothetical protein